MDKHLPIPEHEQLVAISSGYAALHKLLEEYLGDLNTIADYRRYLTVSKMQLSDYLRRHPDLARKHISKPTDPRYHEMSYLECVDGRYRVYEMDHDVPISEQCYGNLEDAAAACLMWGLTLSGKHSD